MFTLDTVIDTATKNTKQVVSYIENEKIRENLLTLVDAQVAVTKSVYEAAQEYFSTIAESAKKFEVKEWDFAKMFAPVKKSK